EAILDEAAKDYDLMVLGAPGRVGSTEVVFHPLVDHLVSLSPCTTLIVQGDGPEGWSPGRILVPANGSVAARHAADFAFNMAAPTGEPVEVLNVATPDREPSLDPEGRHRSRHLAAAH